nr:hypothetical protein [Trichormus variabilis]
MFLSQFPVPNPQSPIQPADGVSFESGVGRKQFEWVTRSGSVRVK